MRRAWSIAAVLLLAAAPSSPLIGDVRELPAYVSYSWVCCPPVKSGNVGPAVDGFVLALTTNYHTAHVGDPLVLEVRLENLSNADKEPMRPAEQSILTVAGHHESRAWAMRLPAFDRWNIKPAQSEVMRLAMPTSYSMIEEPGSYVVRVEMPFSIGDKSGTLWSNPLVLTMGSPVPGNRFVPTPTPAPTPLTDAVVERCRVCEGASRRTPTGRVADGFALSLTASNTQFQLGQPIPVVVELRNIGKKSESIFFGIRVADYDFEVRNIETGEVVPADPGARLWTISHMPTSYFVLPDQSLYGSIAITSTRLPNLARTGFA